MNPLAPVSMLAGKGSGTAVAVLVVLVGLAFVASQQTAQPKSKN